MKQISEQPVLWHCEAASQRKSIPVLFVHGMWGWHWYWSNFINVFTSSGYECYAIDVQGHGPAWKSQVQGNVSLGKYVEEIKSAINIISEKDRPPILIGHSMGGLLAQKTAEGIGVRGIVLIASGIPKGILVVPTFRTALIFLKYSIPALLNRKILPNNKEVKYMVFHDVEGEELKWALERYVPESGRAFWQLITSSVSVDNSKVNCPVLVVGGGKDRVINPRASKNLAKKYNAELLVFNDNSHWLIREDGWQKICNEILEWIEQNGKSL